MAKSLADMLAPEGETESEDMSQDVSADDEILKDLEDAGLQFTDGALLLSAIRRACGCDPGEVEDEEGTPGRKGGSGLVVMLKPDK